MCSLLSIDFSAVYAKRTLSTAVHSFSLCADRVYVEPEPTALGCAGVGNRNDRFGCWTT